MDRDLLAGTCEDRIVGTVPDIDDRTRKKRRIVGDGEGSWACVRLTMLGFIRDEKLGAR